MLTWIWRRSSTTVDLDLLFLNILSIDRHQSMFYVQSPSFSYRSWKSCQKQLICCVVLVKAWVAGFHIDLLHCWNREGYIGIIWYLTLKISFQKSPLPVRLRFHCRLCLDRQFSDVETQWYVEQPLLLFLTCSTGLESNVGSIFPPMLGWPVVGVAAVWLGPRTGENLFV